MKTEPTEDRLRPLKAIRAFCLECQGGTKAVRECATTNCVLHPYRMGMWPSTYNRLLKKREPIHDSESRKAAKP